MSPPQPCRKTHSTPGSPALTVSRSGPGLADELLGYGADVVVEEPAELRARIIERLAAVEGAVHGAVSGEEQG